MCAIAGILRRDGLPPDRDAVARMLAAMAHRGPDGAATHLAGPAAIGHARLAVRDLSALATQPLVTGDGCVLAYNGEIYGEAPLRRTLEAAGDHIEGHGDARVLLAALARHGVAWTLPRIDGMFAFAWWDARTRILHLVRDRFGIKPLHVAATTSFVAFASELRALRTLDGVAARPDVRDLARRLLPGGADESRSPFAGVENVPPGGWWRIGQDGIERTTWCDPALDVDPARIIAGGRERPAAWEARATRALETAVRDHLASDVPVAAFTSGGVDSNLVAALALRDRPDLVAYTVDTLDPRSELAAATAAARHLGLPLHPVPMDRATFLARFADTVLAYEHPLPHPCLVPTLLLAERARADGIVVALTGEGADELFGGYQSLARTWRLWRRAEAPPWRWLPGRRARRRALAELPFSNQAGRREPGGRASAEAALCAAADARARTVLAHLAGVGPAHDRAFLAHALDALRTHLSWLLLRHDRLSMAASIEARVPFLCRTVSDVALHLPPAAKLRQGHLKWVLRRIADHHLPRGQAWTQKQGFSVPDAHHAGTAAVLRGGLAAELLGWTRAAAEERLPVIEAQPRLRVRMLGLETWARLYLARESPGQVTERILARAAG